MQNRALLLLIAVFVVYLAVHLQKMNEIGFNWAGPPKADELYLTEFPKEVGGTGSFAVFSSTASSCALCGRPVSLVAGENRLDFGDSECGGNVSLSCGVRSLSFTYSPPSGARYQNLSARVYVENRTIFVNVFGSARTPGYEPLEIYVDGELASSPLYRFDGPVSVIEGVQAASGSHLVQVVFNGAQLADEIVEVPQSFSMAAFLTLVLIAGIAVAYKDDMMARLLASFVLLVASLVIGLRLRAGLDMEMLVPIALFAFLISLVLTEKKHSPQRAEGRLDREALLFGAGFAAFILLVNVFISSYDVWGAYYFRHTQTTFERGSTNYFDELSYLGREFTYPPIFFEFAAQLTNIFAQSFEQVRVPLNIFLAFLFTATIYLLFRRLEPRSRLLAALMLISQWTILVTASGIGIHMLAFSLLNISVILIERNAVASIVALALGFATHPLALVFFPLWLYVSNGLRVDWKRTIAWPVLATILSLPFYLPIFLRSGLPYEIVPQRWGYLLTYGIDGIRFDFQFLLPLLLAAVVWGLLVSRHRIPALLLAVLLLFNAFVSLRAGPAVAIVGAALFPTVFQRELRNRAVFAALLALYILPNFILGVVVLSGTSYYCSWGLANEVCSKPMEYLAKYTPSSARVAIDPIYGHLETWKGRRPVLADLYVEYADYEKWKAENDFAWSGNATAVERYNITIYALHDFHNTPRSVPFDRVYDNGYMHIFRRA